MDAKLYDELYRVEQTHWWFQARRHIVWSLVRRYVDASTTSRLRICELGCGTGGNLAPVAKQHDVIGVECSPQAIEYARSRLGNRVIRGSLPGDVPLPPNSFDVVLLTDVLEHIQDDAASARTALQLLRPGGIVVATVPAYQWLYSPRDAHHHHFRRYSKQRFRTLWTATNVQTLLISHYNSLLFPPAAAVRLASRIRPERKAQGDLHIPPRQLNGLLARIMRSEANMLGRLPMPFGLSLVAVARNTSSDGSTVRAAA
jgi:2-polyprenyl-3-methyl-5-hydroxy-6-metoxy-1,4-benzoquinol methylase